MRIGNSNITAYAWWKPLSLPSIGTLGGLWIVLDSIQVFQRDGWGALVTAGPRNNHEKLPWFFFTGVGLIVMAACLWSLYVMLRDPQE